MRYKSWGEVRFSWTATPSTTPAYTLPSYTFTGQYSYMDDPSTTSITDGFGLMFYNARMYDPAIGRFTSADSIVPGGVQGLDRYAYTNNSPVNYVDPSGHCSLSGHWISDTDTACQWDIPLSSQAQSLIGFSDSVGLTPEEVIGIGLGHEMMNNPADRDKQMYAFRNGFLRYADEHCKGNPTYNCMLNYFGGSFQSVYNQFIDSDGNPTTFWGEHDNYLWAQYNISDKGKILSNLSPNNQAIVKSGINFAKSFMDTISSYSYDPNLPLNTGVYNRHALLKALNNAYPTFEMGFLVVLPAQCSNGTNALSLVFNLWGEQAIGSLKDC